MPDSGYDERVQRLLERYERLRAQGKPIPAEVESVVKTLRGEAGANGHGNGGESGRREAEKERMRQTRATDREIDIAPCANPERRAAAADSLTTFVHTYFPHLTYIESGAFQIDVTGMLERLIKYGGMRAIAGPRGYAKDMLTNLACMWGVLNGYLKFPIVVRSDQPEAVKHLDIIKRELASNDLLAEDYPGGVRADPEDRGRGATGAGIASQRAFPGHGVVYRVHRPSQPS